MKELSARAEPMKNFKSNRKKATGTWNLSRESYEFVSWNGNV
jgi:hypothetical protein